MENYNPPKESPFLCSRGEIILSIKISKYIDLNIPRKPAPLDNIYISFENKEMFMAA